jgi:two-component system phosphate regulon sensor histidine kinase PhoR
MFRSIRWRIALPYVLLILIVMSALEIYLSTVVRQTYFDELESQLGSEARIIADALPSTQAASFTSQAFDQQARRWAQLLNARVTLIREDGVVIGESDEDRSLMDNHANRPEVIEAINTGLGTSIRLSATSGVQMMYVAVPVIQDGKLRAIARISVPTSQIQNRVSQLERALFLIMLVTSAIAVILAALIAESTSRPLRRLTQAVTLFAGREAGEISIGDSVYRTREDEIGRLTRAFNHMADRLRSQIQALETERGKSAAVLKEMTDGVVIVNEQGQIQLINPAAEAMFNTTEQEALGHSMAEVLRHHQLVELWRQCQDTGETQLASMEISTQGLYLQGIATPLGEALPGNILLLFQNLTRQRFLETVRRDFISNISHELRTPLASLKALTETLQEGALDDPPAAQRFIKRIEIEVDALTQMVSELLELSRIESGRIPLRLQPTSPAEILHSAVERLQAQSKRAGLNVEVNCQTDLPDVLADPDRLEQVLVNLLHNAIKFTPSGGSISLRAALVDDSVLFSVRDTGLGIPADDLPRIFERFYKADRARSSGGTGLGLAIARHTIQNHGGEIWAESVEGQGSTFYFSVPLAK